MKGNTGSMTLNMMTKFFHAHLVKSLFSLKNYFLLVLFSNVQDDSKAVWLNRWLA